jgi:DNA-binding NarL/FixJ family response regulator
LKRVLIVHGEHLLSSGVERLLTLEKDFEIRSTPEGLLSTLSDELVHFQPQVVVIDQICFEKELSWFYSMMRAFPGIRFIVIDLKKNIINIYSQFQVEVSRGSDLIATIRGS